VLSVAQCWIVTKLQQRQRCIGFPLLPLVRNVVQAKISKGNFGPTLWSLTTDESSLSTFAKLRQSPSWSRYLHVTISGQVKMSSLSQIPGAGLFRSNPLLHIASKPSGSLVCPQTYEVLPKTLNRLSRPSLWQIRWRLCLPQIRADRAPRPLRHVWRWRLANDATKRTRGRRN
jgi:hypothetical protein